MVVATTGRSVALGNWLCNKLRMERARLSRSQTLSQLPYGAAEQPRRWIEISMWQRSAGSLPAARRQAGILPGLLSAGTAFIWLVNATYVLLRYQVDNNVA